VHGEPSDRVTKRAQADEPLVPPRWARALDIASVLLVAAAAAIAIWGGVRLRLGALRLSLGSPARLLIWATVITAARHLLAPVAPIYRDLPRRLAAWRRARIRNDVAEPAGVGSRRFAVATVILMTALTAVMTYPQMFRLRDTVYDPGDPLLNLWVLRWIAHQLPRDPTHLFDGNIFAPERNTLAYSETLLAPGILTAPLAWLGVSAIAVYNLVFVGGIIASGVGAALLVRDLTGDAGAAVVSGAIFAFLPFRFDHFAQLQLQQGQWIPLALLAFHRVMWRGRVRDGVWLGVFVAAQLLSCMYYGIFLGFYLTVVGVFLLLWQTSAWRSRIPVLLAGVAVALLLFAPAARSYIAAREVVGQRGILENITFSAAWTDYLAAPDTNRLYGWTARRFGGGVERQLFQGLTAMLLAAVALWPPWSAVRAAYALGLAFAVDLTLGFNGLTYPFFYNHLPVIRALRIPALAVMLVGFSVAVLAGFGAARLSSRMRSACGRAGLVAALCAATVVECISAPVALTAMPRTAPEIYADLLRDIGDGPTATIVEVPMIFAQDPLYQDPIYMYYSTFHWQRLVNGYSGFFPPSYLELAAFMRTFPDARSLDALRQRGARYAIVHGERLTPGEYQRLTRAIESCACGLTLVARRPWQGREISLYRLS
jgi:hypothetical protein